MNLPIEYNLLFLSSPPVLNTAFCWEAFCSAMKAKIHTQPSDYHIKIQNPEYFLVSNSEYFSLQVTFPSKLQAYPYLCIHLYTILVFTNFFNASGILRLNQDQAGVSMLLQFLKSEKSTRIKVLETRLFWAV